MLDALGNIGDFLGGLGVVITLLYLAAQIRQNTRSSKSASYQAAAMASSQMTQNLWLNPEATRILQAGWVDREALNPIELLQFNGLTTAVIRSIENIHYQYLTGAIDGELWAGWERRTRTVIGPPGAQAWWVESRDMFSKDFQAMVDGLELLESP